MNAASPRLRDPAFPARITLALSVAVILWPLLAWSEFKPWTLLDAESLVPAMHFAAGFFPPRLDAGFMGLVLRETWRTIAIATAGLTLALCAAVPLALACTRVLSVSGLSGRMSFAGGVLRTSVRSVLIVLRSVPELIWALVFVRVVGLGPTSGVLAIALTYAGMLGKVYAEILESGDTHAAQALMRNGGTRFHTFFWALLPQNAAELTSYTVYRWECAIRSSAVLGFVGAGGLGQQMDASMKMFNGGEVCTMLIVFVLLVAGADRLSTWLRGRLS